ncbi:eIF2A-related protein [Bailinhaonella thermotolerans]|uniref:WD40 repeat domain-containing protein n=1 Tax=Bailinhaonella thermotolerans TaxID=1070861 RepID=A0A3A4AZE9_9ACTN|nr:AAA family ATPase [Bailinhaonella thermotolerans]RJL35757.1 WD40 repeat domain-containing protein [Bailinhaonella thermotolerans]
MRRQRQLALLLQVLLVVVASLLGIVTNYATDVEETPFYLELLQTIAVPGIGVLIIFLIVGHVVAYRLESPAPPRRSWDRSRTPYPGLDAFQRDEAAVFFGREGQITELTRRLQQSPARWEDRFIPLVGASGSGKSSLVQAGVIPRLGDRRWLVLPVMTPGGDPFGALARALARLDPARDEAGILRRLRGSPQELAATLREARDSQGHRFRRVLLVIDQLEELLTLSGERDRSAFLHALAQALAGDSRLWVLATVRIEFLRDLLETEQADLFQNPVAIGAMDRSQLMQAVLCPGELVDMTFAPGLVETVVDDAGTSDALPLLAYLLQEVYYAVGPGSVVTLERYRALGGVAGALSRQADQVMTELRGEAEPEAVFAVLLKFVTVEGQEATRRRVPLAELPASERRVVDAFVDARLLVTDADDGRPYAHVAHEALFRQWPPLRQEVETRIEQLRQRAELERWAADWRRSGRSEDYLLTGERLALAQRWLAALEEGGQASESVRELVDVSLRRDRAFLRRVSEGIGRYVLANAERYPELSILLSLAALGECAATPAAQRALMAALAFSHLRLVLKGHTDTVRNLAWSPDGAWIATASRDGTARVFDAQTGHCERTLAGHGGMVEMVAWSPDSARLATASRDHTIRVWEVASGATVNVLSGASDVVRGVAWSPDGTRIAGASRDQVVRVWDTTTGELRHALRGHRDNVLGIGWSPYGRLATASHDRTVIIWDLAADRPRVRLEGHTDFVEGLAWSPDGQSLASSSGDHTIRVWDGTTGDQRLLIRGHADQIWNLAWSPDGRRLASVSTDRTARIFDAHDAEPLAVLRGHDDTVWGVTWSPDGSRIATGSEDGTARIWDVRPRGAEERLLTGHDQQLNRAAWSHDGLRVATACDDRTVRLWNAADGEPISVLEGHSDRVWTVAWSPDGSRIATGSQDGTARLWTGTRGAAVLDHHGSAVEAVAWAPDGSRLVTGGHDRSVRIWDARDGAGLAVLTGHQDWVVGAAWSPSGRLIATTSDDRTCRIWEIGTGEQLTVLRGHENWVDDVSWSPDEQYVVTGSADWTARIWEVATGRPAGVLRGHEGRVRGVSWSPDGGRIATGSDDRTVRVWDAATGEEIVVAGVHQDKVTSVAWSPDGRRLLTASYDATARIWPADPDFDRLQAKARGRVFRTLTEDERRSHLLPSSP